MRLINEEITCPTKSQRKENAMYMEASLKMVNVFSSEGLIRFKMDNPIREKLNIKIGIKGIIWIFSKIAVINIARLVTTAEIAIIRVVEIFPLTTGHMGTPAFV